MIRLLHCGEWAIEEHDESQEIPGYAILSHTWELPHPNGDAKEVNYQDIKNRIASENPADRPSATAWLKSSGWSKVENARKEAWELGSAWIWIDSCCIDNSDHQEHTEAINSMYQWYKNSQVCIAYLSDLQGKILGRNRWFFRGWTLQELIAPPTVFFYNQRWEYCGSRNGRPRRLYQSMGSAKDYEYDKNEDLSARISQITSIDASLLAKNDPGQIEQELSAIPACQKMHWAWLTTTSRTEDMAYCLIGIFDINHFYLKRGERDGAFIRLQEEIIKQTGDPTLFAWRATRADQCVPENRLRGEDLRVAGSLFNHADDLHGIFACRPSEFQYTNNIQSFQHTMYNDEIAVTSKGVKFTAAALWGEGPTESFIMSINSYDKVRKAHLGIQLRWIGGNVYARTDVDKLKDLDIGRALPSQDDVFISRKIHSLRSCAAFLTENAFQPPLHIKDGPVSLTRVFVTPGALWSEDLGIFLTSGTKLPVGYATYSQDDEPSRIFTILFGLSYIKEPWSCLIEPGSELAPSPTEMRRAYLDRVWRKAFQLQSHKARLASDGVIYAAASTTSKSSYRIAGHCPFVLGLRVTKDSRLERHQRAGRQHDTSRSIKTSPRSRKREEMGLETARENAMAQVFDKFPHLQDKSRDNSRHIEPWQKSGGHFIDAIGQDFQRAYPQTRTEILPNSNAEISNQHDAEAFYTRKRSYGTESTYSGPFPHIDEITRERKLMKIRQMGVSPAMPGTITRLQRTADTIMGFQELTEVIVREKMTTLAHTTRGVAYGEAPRQSGIHQRPSQSRIGERPEATPDDSIAREPIIQDLRVANIDDSRFFETDKSLGQTAEAFFSSTSSPKELDLATNGTPQEALGTIVEERERPYDYDLDLTFPNLNLDFPESHSANTESVAEGMVDESDVRLASNSSQDAMNRGQGPRNSHTPEPSFPGKITDAVDELQSKLLEKEQQDPSPLSRSKE